MRKPGGYLGHLKVQHLKVLVKQRMKQLKQVRNAESLFEAVHDLQEAIAIRVVRDKDFNCFVFRHAVPSGIKRNEEKSRHD